MARELTYLLHDPGYTLYHRAALGGLAATLLALKDEMPSGLMAEVSAERVRLSWDASLTAQQAVKALLHASFRLTKEGLIDLPGQNVPAGALSLRLAIHNGLCMTFLQHNKMRPSEKQPRFIDVRGPDDETATPFSYKALHSYAHQHPTSTGLLKTDKRAPSGTLPAFARIAQYVVPGAVSGAHELEAPAGDVFLLLYLMVGCAVFLLRPHGGRARAQACVAVPDVSDLVRFGRSLRALAGVGAGVQRFSNTYLGRVVGGAEEAALRFLLDLSAEDVEATPGVSGCVAVTMGKLAWDPNQVNRSGSVRLGRSHPELGVFRAAVTHLGRSRVLRNKKGAGFAVPQSPLPELVAANLGAQRHWAAHFRDLVKTKTGFSNLMFQRRGVQKMNEAIQDEDDRLVIRAFHEAWRRTLGEMGERSRREAISFERLVEVEQERVRNAILRLRTAEALSGWFLRFCASATKGGSLGALRENMPRLHAFLFQPRQAERLQNLMLFALLSYSSESPRTDSTSHSAE